MVRFEAGMEGSPRPTPADVRRSPPRPIRTPPVVPVISPALQIPRELQNGASKILGRNANGTMVVTAAPSNEAELQLYRVLQRASLLAYYDTLLEMGGDDVQQLCDAGEEEFLEIMALVGMASKPLHVRRLQKALQEWVTNPAVFQVPITPRAPDTAYATNCAIRQPIPISRHAAPSPDPRDSLSPGVPESNCASDCSLTNASPAREPVDSRLSAAPTSTTCGGSIAPISNPSRSVSPSRRTALPASSGSSPSSVSRSPVLSGGTSLPPSLPEAHVRRLATAAERISRHLPRLEPRPQNAKKKMCRDLEAVIAMPENDPRRMEEIRKYAAIYGRFDCKRKPEKPLTLHEVSVNEAAAQMCRAMPALLTRRDELFPLARQVVRLSGFHYSKGQSQISSTCGDRPRSDSEGGGVSSAAGAGSTPGPKRPRRETDRDAGQEKPFDEDEPPLSHALARGEGEGSDRNHSYSSMWGRVESDDADSRYSFSNSSSSPVQEPDDVGRTEAESSGTCRDARVRIVAASGDHIIAVANPALAIHRTLLPKKECPSPLDNNN